MIKKALRALKKKRAKSKPSLHAQRIAPTWYHGNISRAVAEGSLASARSGTYLVRDAQIQSPTDCDSSRGLATHAFSLSIRVLPQPTSLTRIKVKHYRILQSLRSKWFELETGVLDRPQFPTIRSLVQFFNSSSPSRTDRVRLMFPCCSTTDDDEDGNYVLLPRAMQPGFEV
jgi:hypothetical protein